MKLLSTRARNMYGRLRDVEVATSAPVFGSRTRRCSLLKYVAQFRHALVFFFSSRRRHTRSLCDWSSDVCSSDLRMFHVKDAEFLPSGRQGIYGGYSSWLERAGRFRSLGDGQVDFKAIFSKFAQYDYQGWASLEWRSEERRVGEECRSRWWPYH